MTIKSLTFVLALLAVVVFVPPPWKPRELEVRAIDEVGRDRVAPRALATVEWPDRSKPGVLTFWHDFAYAAAAAGPLGCLVLLGGVLLVTTVLGLWCHGTRCGLRRMMVTIGLGVPLSMGLLYASCFLEGRMIRLGPEAAGYVPASLHTHTHRTTGLLSPKQVVEWHVDRGFRVLNISDNDTHEPALEAQAAARKTQYRTSVLVLVGEEWHGTPHVVLVNVRQTWDPHELSLEETVAGVHEQGGAVILAHPWSKLRTRTIEDVLAGGVDAIEAVNGVIHGGSNTIQKAKNARKGLVGAIDYKYGPNVNVLTLIPADKARSPRGVVEAIRSRRTRILYAVPGGAMTGELWAAGTIGTSGALAGLRSLVETTRPRRAGWYPWLAGFTLLWWLATRPRRAPAMSKGVARALFIACFVLELLIPAGLSWQVRAMIGTIPVTFLLAAAGLVAVPMLAASHALAGVEDP